MLTLLGRSVMVLALLFGLLFAGLMAVFVTFNLPWWFAVAAAVGVAALQYLTGPRIIQRIYRIRWTAAEDVSPRLAAFIEESCRRLGIPAPRFGVIADGTPNAFTFGHYPQDARLVVTQGLLDMLTDEEREAVIAHELGHIAHRDFVVMTIAAVAPLVLYTIVQIGARSRSRESGRRGAGVILVVVFVSYMLYVVSYYVVLILSRIREYYADETSAALTRRPNALATALVKVAYGLTRASHASEHTRGPHAAQAGKVLGIFDPTYASALALAAAGTAGGQVSPDRMVEAMKWDLWNPWARVYQLNSSHPLPAHRLRALENLSHRFDQPPAFDFPETPPEGYWDEFAADLAVAALPYAGAAVGAVAALWMVRAGISLVAGGGVFLTSLGLAYLLKMRAVYPAGEFPIRPVASLLGEIKVSGLRCIPCQVRGTIIGRGVPGLIVSGDLVLQDETGFLALDYGQPLGFLEFLFGAFRAERLIGRAATVSGWYRREPRPYLELRDVVLDDGTRERCRAYGAKRAIAIGLTALGVLGLAAGLLHL